MDQDNQNVMELLEKMAEDNAAQNKYLKKQLTFTRIFAISGCVLTAALLIVVLLIVPPLMTAMDDAIVALNQASVTLTKVNGTLANVDDALAEVQTNVQTLFEEGGLVGKSSEALSQATDKISRMDIESLNEAIKDLGDVVEPLANFFGKFKK